MEEVQDTTTASGTVEVVTVSTGSSVPLHMVAVKAEYLVKKKDVVAPTPTIIPAPAVTASNTDTSDNTGGSVLVPEATVGTEIAPTETAADTETTTVATETSTSTETTTAVATSSAASNSRLHGIKAEKAQVREENNQNKKRQREHRETTNVCRAFVSGKCQHGDTCHYSHDLQAIMTNRQPDLGSTCYKYSIYGRCDDGITCRFGSSHTDPVTGVNLSRPAEEGGVIERIPDINLISKDLQLVLRKRIHKNNKTDNAAATATATSASTTRYEFGEKPFKLVDFSRKVYIAPLTTIGNLPFRRILKDMGADITCGEMALSGNLSIGKPSEWALLKRHASEDCFGVQIASAQQDHMEFLSKVLEKHTVTDFVDLNCGCPIDIVTDKGCGSSLMLKPRKLCDIVSSMIKNMPSRSITVKVRTGWDDKSINAHKIIHQLQSISHGKIAAIFIHGRTRQQRYTKEANWDYIFEAAKAQDPSQPRIPIIGNGDIMSYEDWKNHQSMLSDNLENDEVGLCSCAMLARGAIMKPWLPQELKECRSIDISASERLDILKKFCNYGFDHWGSDQRGVDTTRRFLLEWLGYLHRYVPVSLVERTQKMQQRPPHYFGRCDMETLMASTDSRDWLRISELLLGPVPKDYQFEGKHKSNAYSGEHDCNG